MLWWWMTTAWALPGVVGLEAPAVEDEPELELPVDRGQAPDAYVWNGTEADDKELLETVALVVGGPGWGIPATSFCSGTLIHPEWVLTAAHCLDDLDAITGGYDDALSIAFGASSPYLLMVPFAQTASGPEVYLHPDYDTSSGQAGEGADIGLVHLDGVVSGVSPAVLNDEPVRNNWLGREILHAGYGIVYDDGPGGGTKRWTVLPIEDFGGDVGGIGSDPWADMVVTYNGSNSLYGSQALNSTSNLCQGDSGGSSFEVLSSGARELVGVNAIVYGGCVNGATGATRVDLYIDWIAQYVPTILTEQSDGSDEGFGQLDPLLDEDYVLPDAARTGVLPETLLGDAVRPDEVDAFSGCSAVPTGPGWAGAWGLVFALLWRRRADYPSVG